jgi:hypothetical protein
LLTETDEKATASEKVDEATRPRRLMKRTPSQHRNEPKELFHHSKTVFNDGKPVEGAVQRQQNPNDRQTSEESVQRHQTDGVKRPFLITKLMSFSVDFAALRDPERKNIEALVVE